MSEIVLLYNALRYVVKSFVVGLEIMYNIVLTRKRSFDTQEIDFQMNFWKVSRGITGRY